MTKKKYSFPDIGILILILLTFFALSVEVFKGSGSIGKHFFVDSRLILAITATLIFMYDFHKSDLLRFIEKIFSYLSYLLILTYMYFVFIESSNYTNYVLSVYKIHLDALILLPIFAVFISIIPRINLEKNFKPALLVVSTLIVYYLLTNLSQVINDAFTDDVFVLTHLNFSYNQKMEYVWGNYFDLMLFVKNNTPQNAKIIIPPGINPWLARSGDIYLDRAFLYPRELLEFNGVSIPKEVLTKGTYVLISWGMRDCYEKDCHGWPKQKIFASKILYKDPDSFNVIEIKQNTNYLNDDNKYVYGLIEI